MSDQQPVPVERRQGLLALTPYVTALGVLAIVYLMVMRSRQTEDGPLDLLTSLIALSVGLTVFCGLWWVVTSRGARDVAAWWRADDPTAHVHAPIWGTTTVTCIVSALFYNWFEDRIGAFGVVFSLCVLQVVVLNIVGRYLGRRLGMDVNEREVASTLKSAMLVTGGPFILLAVVLFIFEVPVLTDSTGGDLAVGIFLLGPAMIFLLYIGFAIVYGAGDAIGQTWSGLFGRGEGSS